MFIIDKNYLYLFSSSLINVDNIKINKMNNIIGLVNLANRFCWLRVIAIFSIRIATQKPPKILKISSS
jgi:hypothetical protein